MQCDTHTQTPPCYWLSERSVCAPSLKIIMHFFCCFIPRVICCCNYDYDFCRVLLVGGVCVPLIRWLLFCCTMRCTLFLHIFALLLSTVQALLIYLDLYAFRFILFMQPATFYTSTAGLLLNMLYRINQKQQIR